MVQQAQDLVGHTLGIAPLRTLPGQPLQRLLRRQAGDRRLFRVLVDQLVEAEAAALGDLERPGERLRIAGEQPVHLRGGLEMPVAGALAPEAEVVDGAALADAGDDLLQDPPRRMVEEHVTGDDGAHPRVRGEG